MSRERAKEGSQSSIRLDQSLGRLTWARENEGSRPRVRVSAAAEPGYQLPPTHLTLRNPAVPSHQGDRDQQGERVTVDTEVLSQQGTSSGSRNLLLHPLRSYLLLHPVRLAHTSQLLVPGGISFHQQGSEQLGFKLFRSLGEQGLLSSEGKLDTSAPVECLPQLSNSSNSPSPLISTSTLLLSSFWLRLPLSRSSCPQRPCHRLKNKYTFLLTQPYLSRWITEQPQDSTAGI